MPVLVCDKPGLGNSASQMAREGTFQVTPRDRGVGSKQYSISETILPSDGHKLLKMAMRHERSVDKRVGAFS